MSAQQSQHSCESVANRTLYSVILGGVIDWAGDDADLDDCREIARHLTPIVREYARHLPPAGSDQ